MNENPNEPGPPTATDDPQEEARGQSSDGPRVSGPEMRDLSRLRRSSTDKRVAGVAGGLGRHLDIDPVILRVAFVVLTFFGGAGLLLYAAGWLLLPLDRTGEATLHIDDRSRTVALVGVGVLAVLLSLGDWGGWYWFPWPLAVVALIAWLVLSNRDRPRSPSAPPPAGASPEEFREYAATGSAPAGPHRNPRKRGPVLFWFTLALVALALGTLGIVDLADVNVPDPAYPALALAIIAGMLLLGAFWGRAGGLILVGLIALVALVGATAADRHDGRSVVERPTAASEVQDDYETHTGDLVLDLTTVEDVEDLDGRTLDLSVGAGRLEVIVPEELGVEVEASAGIGAVNLFGSDRSGFGVSHTAGRGDAGDVADIRIDATVGVGEIEVSQR